MNENRHNSERFVGPVTDDIKIRRTINFISDLSKLFVKGGLSECGSMQDFFDKISLLEDVSEENDFTSLAQLKKFFEEKLKRESFTAGKFSCGPLMSDEKVMIVKLASGFWQIPLSNPNDIPLPLIPRV